MQAKQQYGQGANKTETFLKSGAVLLLVAVIGVVYQTDRKENKEFQKSLLSVTREMASQIGDVKGQQIALYSHLQNNDAKIEENKRRVEQTSKDARKTINNQIIFCTYAEREWVGHRCERPE